MSISQFRIAKLGLGAVATTSLLVGLSGCVVVPYAGQDAGRVYPSSSTTSTYYPQGYQPYYSPPLTSPYASPWSEPYYFGYPSYPSFPNYPYPSRNLPAAQVRPVDNGPIPLDRDGSNRYESDRGNLPAAQVRPVN